MKRLLCLILVCTVALCFGGCKRPTEAIDMPASFYYCLPSESYETIHMVISSETRESKAYNQDLQGLINLYLQGPQTEDLINPFPDSVHVESISRYDTNIEVILSSRFARLTGVDLTLACACLSMTLMEYTQCENVSISVQNVSLDGNESITMTRDSLLLESITNETTDE